MNISELDGKRIAVLLSGGVDSSVVVYELVRQGLKPDCFYIKIGASPNPSEGIASPPPPPKEGEYLQEEKGKLQPQALPLLWRGRGEAEWDCSMEEDLEMATAVARKYGCSLEVVDCHREYWNQVTRYTMEKVRAGLTPNPDVMCNRLIKFGAFDEKRGHDYDLIATGHYAQKESLPPAPSEGGGVPSGRMPAGAKGEASASPLPPPKEGEYPQGEYPQGEYPQGEYPQGEYPQGECPQGECPQEQKGKLQPQALPSFGGAGDGGKLPLLRRGRGEAFWLCTSPDPVKDQTDFLAQIYGWQLEKALFPIGHYMKDEVRQIAEREHLVSAHRRDSQGICFLGKINYNEYVRRYLGEQPGDVVELETGRRIGQHRGLWFHTIGQRKGMGLSGGPWFVVKKDVAQNVLYVSHGYDPLTAYKQTFPIHDFHSINGQLPPERVTLKIRHTPEYLPARLEPLPYANGASTGTGASSPAIGPSYMVHADAPIHGVAPGQFCVIYDDRHHRCYGSGEITV